MYSNAFPEHEMHDIFPFSYFYPVSDFMNEYYNNGWNIYEHPEDEFKRQGIDFYNVRIEVTLIFNIVESCILTLYKPGLCGVSNLSLEACNSQWYRNSSTNRMFKVQNKTKIPK